jgi:hypothetical protein
MRARVVKLTAVTVLLLAVTGLAGDSNVAAAPSDAPGPFSCGPHTLTYTVTAPDGRGGSGFRCVKYPASSAHFAWYGEGQWGGATYRHVGEAHKLYSTTFQKLPLQGYAANIFGNGEDFHGTAAGTLEIEVVSGDWPSPDAIHVGGAWNEDWTLVTSTSYAPLPAPKTCGGNFDQYEVSALDGRPGSGIRCVLGMSHRATWYGNGEWNGARYTHIGTLNVSSPTGEASDLCDPAFGEYCSETPYDGLSISPASPRGFDVTGAWNERWR